MNYEHELQKLHQPPGKLKNLHQLAGALDRAERRLELELDESKRVILQAKRALADVITITPYTLELALALADALEEEISLITDLDGGNYDNWLPDRQYASHTADRIRLEANSGNADALRDIVRGLQ